MTNAPATLFWQSWTAPKEGNDPQQNEDCIRAQLMSLTDGAETLLVAIADGASETVYSHAWAQTLVNAAESAWPSLTDQEFDERLRELRQMFSPLPKDQPIPWYVRNKFLTQGSQATLLVATITSREKEAFEIQAMAIGDCCLLLLKANGEVHSFPLSTSDQFGLNPNLIASRPQGLLSCVRCNLRFEAGDALLVCTDAVGKWALECLEGQQADLLFEALIGLLTPTTGVPVPPPAPAYPTSPAQDRVLPDCGAADVSLAKRLWRLMKRLRDGGEQEESEESVPDGPASSVGEARSPEPLEFSEFLEQRRAPDSRPHMRNDDSTLLVCVPIATDPAQKSPCTVISGLREKVGWRLQPPLNEQAL